jgi:AraC-like DNA-binding protein
MQSATSCTLERHDDWTNSSSAENPSTSARLLAELTNRARDEGANVGLWPGLTIYRFTRPTRPRWDEVDSPSLYLVAHRGTGQYPRDEGYGAGYFGYGVIGSRDEFDRNVVEASPDHPCLFVVLRVEPQVVRTVAATMRGREPTGLRIDDHAAECPMSALDDELTCIVLRFLRSLSSLSDRRVLAPLYLQETVYRVLQGEHSARLMHLAARQAMSNPLAAALDYIAEHLAEPLTVDTLAAQVNLSPSAFSRAFRERTDRSPYQYVKQKRLDWARELLDVGRLGVADVSRAVGYTSVSHFIKEFRARFGATPGDYLNTHTFRRRTAFRRAQPNTPPLATAAS